MSPLCEYAIDRSVGLSVNVVCSKTQEFCGMIRYCSAERRPVMNSNYYKYGCKIKQSYGDNMAKRRKQTIVSSEIEKSMEELSNQSEIKTIECTVSYTKNGSSSLQYPLNGRYYNIMVKGTYSGNVTVTYKGELNTNNIISIG